MSTMDNSSAEQLWYTWSDVGLSTVHAGFRIRAASPGLTEIYSERVKGIDRYMRYVLPSGTDPFAITPDMAPISLAFIRTDSEYILVHKKYVGEDGVGRLGNFFVHVIALGEELSKKLSAADAIMLWGSSNLWKTDDKEQERRSNELKKISLAELRKSQMDSFPLDFVQARQYLPFIIEAYLTRKNRSPLYMAAPAHQVAMLAYLIAALIGCLPRRLVTDLTFSTYESDVTKATMDIVGTSWIPTPGKEIEATRVFSPQFYREKLAINCFNGDCSSLQGHTQIMHNPLASHFANYATECLFTNNMSKLYKLLNDADTSPMLDPDMFLSLYYTNIVKPENATEADIEKYLNDQYLYLGKLRNQTFRKSIVERAAANRQWSDNRLHPRLRELLYQAQREYTAAPSSGRQYTIADTSEAIASEPAQTSSSSPQGSIPRDRDRANTTATENQITLAQALFLLAKRAISDIIKTMISVGAERQKKTEVEAVATLLSLMDDCLLPQNSLAVWTLLFEEITKHPNGKAVAFLKTHWEIFSWLLKKWDHIFPTGPEYDNAIRPLLIIPWSWLGAFLKLNLRQRHRQWNVMAVEKLIQDASLTPQIAQGLEQSNSTEINYLLAQLLQETNYTMATSFATRLIENNYPVKSQFAALIENLLAQLVRNAQLWSDAKNLVVTLTNNGYVGTDAYLNLVEVFLDALLATNPKAGIELIDILVAYGYSKKKNLVDLMLKSKVATLESILPRIYRTDDQLNTFFIQYGSYYLSEPDQVIAMRAIYQKLLLLPQKLERLVVLLDTLRDGTMILQLVTMTSLEEIEHAAILEHYGRTYLKMHQQTSPLADKVVEWYIQLVNSGYSGRFKLLLTLFTSATDPRLLEKLLSSAQLSLGESREFFRNYGSNQHYFPFFYWSETALKLFSDLAQRANTLAANGQTEPAMEKMNLLYTWLQPPQSQPPLPYQTVERILRAASLTSNEQIDFLEHYGGAYLLLYPQLSILKEYVGTYVSELNEDSLEQVQTKGFFAFLTQKYQLSFLDTGIQNRIQWWMTIDSYLNSPYATPDRLKFLAIALFNLRLPGNTDFITKLAKAFVSCANKGGDLDVIIKQMQAVPKIQNNLVQLLYIIAEQGAELYQRHQHELVLVPSLSLVLSNTQESFVQSNIHEGQKYFRQVFLDTLLCNINVLDIQKWKRLDVLLTQCGFSYEALEQWHDYLNGLSLLDRLRTDEGKENNSALQEAQPQSSLPITNDSKPASLLARVQSTFKFASSDYRVAKKKLDNALRSRKVDLIAEAWTLNGAIISESHPERITERELAEINASNEFEQYYQAVTKNPNGPIDYAKKLVELHRAIKALDLQLSSQQNECVAHTQARIQAQPGSGQPYQNPGRISSGSLPRQNNSSLAGQTQQDPGPKPLELNPRSISRDTPEKQPPPGVTRFDIN